MYNFYLFYKLSGTILCCRQAATYILGNHARHLLAEVTHLTIYGVIDKLGWKLVALHVVFTTKHGRDRIPSLCMAVKLISLGGS